MQGGSTRSEPLPDVELVRRIKAGDSIAFGVLVSKYQDRVFNTCWRISGHIEDARDLTQEAFLKVFEGVARFREESGFYTWLFRIAVNLALSHRRKAKRRREVGLENDGQMAGTQAAQLLRAGDGRMVNPADSLGEAELMTEAVRALHALEDDHRAVVVLRDVEGFDYHEIGTILAIPPGTVRSRLHRAREELRRLMLPALKRSK